MAKCKWSDNYNNGELETKLKLGNGMQSMLWSLRDNKVSKSTKKFARRFVI